MCGIAGIFQRKGQLSGDATTPVLRQMAKALHHRGPDEQDCFIDDHVGFAHTRLSIVDLASGQQPMRDAQTGVTLVYNGEVFNYPELRQELMHLGHRFLTQSDTEVVLRAYLEYGAQFVHRLNGQFAMAIWDPRVRKVVLVRDRVGICPLFYSVNDRKLVFGSEVKAMLPVLDSRPQLNLSVLDEIFTFWTPLGNDSIFEGVHTVQPGEMVIVGEQDIVTDSYWGWQYSPEPTGRGSESALTDELYELLLDATRVRLRSDVPVGAYLSGGLDSSSITALVNRISPQRLKTFSLGFDEAGFDESAFQRELISKLNVDHHHLQATNADIAAAFVRSIWHAESPVLRAAPVPMGLLSGAVHQQGYKVVLTGEGADEVFGGYDLFKEAKIRQFWARQPDSASRPLLLKKLYPYLSLPDQGQAEYLKSFFGVMLDQPDHALFSHMPRWITTAKSKRFYSDDLKSHLADDALARAETQFFGPTRAQSPFNRAQYIESHLLMPGYLLSSQGDRMLSMNSVEGRFPFLDHRVIDFAGRLPVSLKMNVLNEKFLLKQAMQSELPESIWKRHKQPFRAPDSQLIRSLLTQEETREYLTGSRLRHTGLFAPDKVNRLMNKASQKGLNISESQSLIGILSTQIIAEKFTNAA